MRSTEHPEDLLRRFEEHVAHDPHFSAEEAEMMRQIMEAYRTWRVLGRATKWFVLTLATMSAGIVAWEHLVTSLKKWLTS